MKKHTILRFLATYICVLLPMLFATMLITQDFIENAVEEEAKSLDNQVSASAQLLEDYYGNIPQKSVALFDSSTFSSRYVLTDVVTRLEAIGILKNIQYYAGYEESVLVYSGTVSPNVYFGQTLNCNQTDVEAAVSIIQNRERALLFLQSQSAEGYLLYHMPVGMDGYGYERSVEIVTSVSALCKMFRSTLRSEHVILQVMIGDQSLYFYNTQDGCTYITIQRAEALLADFMQVQKADFNTGSMSFRLWCDTKEQMADFYKLRNISILLLCSGLIISLVISLALSYVRFSGLQNLVNYIRRKEPGKKIKGSWVGAEMDYIQTLFHGYILENATSRQQITEYQRILLKQVSMLMLHGSLRDADDIRAALHACRAELNEEYFFVLGIEVEDQKDLEQLDNLLQSDIHAVAIKDEKQMMFVLCELPFNDETQEERRGTANRLLSTLESVDISCVCLAISQVYSEITEVNYAYLESYNMIANTTDLDSKIITWEDFVCSEGNDGTKIGTKYINEFRSAITASDAKAVVDVVSNACDQSEIATDEESRRSLRYAFTQLLVTEISMQDAQELSEGIVEEINEIDTNTQEKFESALLRILQKYFTGRDNAAAFDRILQFVDEHYSQYDFSLEMVAQFANCSKSQMSKMFRSRVGVSYLEYVTQLRMTKAKELLAQTDMNVKDIFCHVGYIDTTNASKKFRAYFGVTPSAYRQSCRQMGSK